MGTQTLTGSGLRGIKFHLLCRKPPASAARCFSFCLGAAQKWCLDFYSLLHWQDSKGELKSIQLSILNSQLTWLRGRSQHTVWRAR